MSRIYQALRQSEEAKSNLIVQMIDASPVSKNGTAVSDVVETPTPAVVAKAATLVETQPEEKSDYNPSPAQAAETMGEIVDFRTVALRVSADVPVFPFDGTDPKSAEQYRVLRTNLLHHRRQPRVIAVSSASPGDGKTTTSINLAGIFALKSDSQVLLIDADLRRCGLVEALGIPAGPGLADVLQGNCSVDDAIVRVDQLRNLCVLPSGKCQINPAELLDSPRWTALAEELRTRFSYIIVDTTPMASLADFMLVQHVCDGYLMVVRPDHTYRPALWNAIDGSQKDRLLGVVLNHFQDWLLWKTQDHYGYYIDRTVGGEIPAR